MAIDTQIPDGPPQFSLDPRLREMMPVFTYDPQAYREGLALAEVPEQAASTLETSITSTRSASEAKYNKDKHQVNIEINPDFLDDFIKKTQKEAPANSWDFEANPISSAINFSLARMAQRMADEISRHPSAVLLDRLEPAQNPHTSMIFAGNLALLAIGGAALAEQTSLDAYQGVGIGLTIGAGLTLIGSVISQNRRESRRLVAGEEQALQELNQRELVFARSEGASAIFSKVVTVG